MPRFMKMCAIALCAVMPFSAITPASAFILPLPTVAETAPLVPVQYRNGDFRRYGDQAYFKGYRGHRDRRPGYRQFNGFWFPLAAFGIGALLGSAIASGAPGYGNYNAHVAWCYDRYRSYRQSDNTFQPYNGPRQLCRSPYG